MHHSELKAIVIDNTAEDYEKSVKFWSAAFGLPVAPAADPAAPFTKLDGKVGGVALELQRLGSGSPRIHLDIVTDNLEEELKRLEALGAERVQKVEVWWIMRAPGGHTFCVIPARDPSTLQNARAWGNEEG